MPRVNVLHDEYEFHDHDPPGYEGGVRKASQVLGASELAVKAFVLPPGQALCPYHYEYVEEWLLVLEGELDVRTPAGTDRATAGDLIVFPPGPDGAHKVSAAGDAPARFVMWSSAREPSVAVYPDSGKVGVWTPNDADEFMFRRADGDVPYYDGETGTTS